MTQCMVRPCVARRLLVQDSTLWQSSFSQAIKQVLGILGMLERRELFGRAADRVVVLYLPDGSCLLARRFELSRLSIGSGKPLANRPMRWGPTRRVDEFYDGYFVSLQHVVCEAPEAGGQGQVEGIEADQRIGNL